MANLFEGVYEGWSLIYKLRLHNDKLRNRWYRINGYTERKRGLFDVIIDSVVYVLAVFTKVCYRALFGFRVKKVYYTSPETGIKSQLPYSKNPPPPPRTIPKERKNKTFIEWCRDNTGVIFETALYDCLFYEIHIYFKGDQLRFNVHPKGKTSELLTIVPRIGENRKYSNELNNSYLLSIVDKHLIKHIRNKHKDNQTILHNSNFEQYGIINDPENGMFIDMSTRPPTKIFNRH